MSATRKPPYAAGDMIHAEYPSQWGTLAGKAPVLTCTPGTEPNRWVVTTRLGSEDLGEAVTMTYVVNSRGNSVGSRFARPVGTDGDE